LHAYGTLKKVHDCAYCDVVIARFLAPDLSHRGTFPLLFIAKHYDMWVVQETQLNGDIVCQSYTVFFRLNAACQINAGVRGTCTSAYLRSGIFFNCSLSFSISSKIHYSNLKWVHDPLQYTVLQLNLFCLFQLKEVGVMYCI